MFNFANFYKLIATDTRLQPWLNVLPQQLTDWQNSEHGDFGRWLKALNKIPVGSPDQIDIKIQSPCPTIRLWNRVSLRS